MTAGWQDDWTGEPDNAGVKEMRDALVFVSKGPDGAIDEWVKAAIQKATDALEQVDC